MPYLAFVLYRACHTPCHYLVYRFFCNILGSNGTHLPHVPACRSWTRSAHCTPSSLTTPFPHMYPTHPLPRVIYLHACRFFAGYHATIVCLPPGCLPDAFFPHCQHTYRLPTHTCTTPCAFSYIHTHTMDSMHFDLLPHHTLPHHTLHTFPFPTPAFLPAHIFPWTVLAHYHDALPPFTLCYLFFVPFCTTHTPLP